MSEDGNNGRHIYGIHLYNGSLGDKYYMSQSGSWGDTLHITFNRMALWCTFRHVTEWPFGAHIYRIYDKIVLTRFIRTKIITRLETLVITTIKMLQYYSLL